MENYEATRNPQLATPVLTAERVGAFLRSVYGWMCAGLAITALVAVFVASSPSLVQAIATNRLVFWGLVIAQLGTRKGACIASPRPRPRCCSLHIRGSLG